MNNQSKKFITKQKRLHTETKQQTWYFFLGKPQNTSCLTATEIKIFSETLTQRFGGKSTTTQINGQNTITL